MMSGDMLWFDGDKNASLVAKVQKALAYYTKKYQRRAELCLINDIDAQGVDVEEVSKACGITVKPAKNVLRFHLWMEVEESLPKAGSEQ